MLKIGVTGGIGSGKTMVCSIIRAMGYPVYNADIEAKNISSSSIDVIKAIKDIFGSDIYVNGYVDRVKLGKMVFGSPELLSKLNQIIHPAVASHFLRWTSENSLSSMVFKEAAILFESGANNNVDKVISVLADKDLRVKRVCNRDGISPDDVLKRMSHQMPDDELINRSDFLIYNNEIQPLVPQVDIIISNLKNLII